jgi:PEP-CTERM motif
METRFDKKLLSQIGLLTGMGVLLPAAGTAEATLGCTTTQCTDTQTFTVTSSPAEVNDPGETSNSDPQSTTATFSKFDPLLGTLTEIDFSLSSTLFGSISISAGSTSTNEPTASGQTSWNASYSLTLPGIAEFFDSKSDSVSCTQGGTFCSAFRNPSSLSFPVIWGDVETQQSILDLYTGAGETLLATFNLDLLLSVFNEGTSPSSASGGGSATWDPPAIEGLTVTYIFTPTSTVPEPGTLALLGMGAMAGLGFARRRLKPDG